MPLLAPERTGAQLATEDHPDLSFTLSFVTGLAALVAISMIRREEDDHWARKIAERRAEKK